MISYVMPRIERDPVVPVDTPTFRKQALYEALRQVEVRFGQAREQMERLVVVAPKGYYTTLVTTGGHPIVDKTQNNPEVLTVMGIRLIETTDPSLLSPILIHV